MAESVEELVKKAKAMRLEQLQEEVAKLEQEKVLLEREKELKLQKVKTQLSLIPSKIMARHPVLSTIAQKLGQGAYQAGRAIGQGAHEAGKGVISFANEQHEAELKRLKYLKRHPKLARQLEYQGAVNNPLNRIAGYNPPTPIFKHKPRHKHKQRHKHKSRSNRVETVAELQEKVNRLKLNKELKQLAEA